jgi:alpha-D-ribose 1-methylphosphonate 5-triphosphate synthase subunit PhnG
MNRRRRTKILIDGTRELPKKLAASVEKKYEITILAEPQEALVMVKMRETAKKSLFYLGEVLVTETKVQLHQQTGTGLVVGHDEERSYWLAIIDAAYQANIQEISEWESMLLEEEATIKEEMKRKQAEILKTKVNFETMDV